MTISTTTTTITYLGNGATTAFTFPFVGVAASDISVSYTNSAGSVTVLNPSQYTLVLNPAAVGALWGIGGTVTYPTSGSPISAGTYLSITRTVPYTQTISIANQGAFYPSAVEQGLDLLELQIQQIETDQLYSIQCPVTDALPPTVLPSATARANGFLGFDSSGNPIVLTTIPSSPSTAAPRRVPTSGTVVLGMSTADSFGGVSIYQSGTSSTSIQLPSTGGPYPIFDGGLNASTYPITILPPAGKTIMGQSNFSFNFNGQAATFYLDGYQVLIN